MTLMTSDNDLNTELLMAELPNPRLVDTAYLHWLYDESPYGPAVQRNADDEGVRVAAFPELTLTGYSVEDLLLQEVVLDEVEEALAEIAAASAELSTLLVVGAPLRHGNRLYNCAVVLHRGEVLAVAPKSFLPTYREFYEKRHFASGAGQQGQFLVRPDWPGADADGEVPFGPDLLLTADDVPGLTVHVEVCEDLWVPVPPSDPQKGGVYDVRSGAKGYERW